MKLLALSVMAPICVLAAVDDSPATRSFERYNIRLRNARRDYAREVSSARGELLRDLRNVERRLNTSGNADQLLVIRGDIERIESEVSSIEDLVERLLGSSYRWAGGPSTYRFVLDDGKLYGRLNDDPPVQWEPVTAITLRTVSPGDDVSEMVFTSDLRSFLYQAPGGELRTGTKAE